MGNISHHIIYLKTAQTFLERTAPMHNGANFILTPASDHNFVLNVEFVNCEETEETVSWISKY